MTSFQRCIATSQQSFSCVDFFSCFTGVDILAWLGRGLLAALRWRWRDRRRFCFLGWDWEGDGWETGADLTPCKGTRELDLIEK
jgi:hypothetical protein